jgi:DNA ligase-1
MSSPAKKRKGNDYKAADQPVRGLDYFFAKQKEKKQEQEANEPKVPDEEEGQKLTDEELARKLQAQWDAEDQQVQSSPAKGRDERGRDDAPPVVENPQEDEASEREEEAVNGSTSTEIATDRSKNTLALQSTATDEDTITTNIPFDESPLTFEPSKYIPDLRKHWATDGENASYALLTRCFVLVNSTQSRIKIVDTLVNLLRTIIEADPDSLLPAVRLQTC